MVPLNDRPANCVEFTFDIVLAHSATSGSDAYKVYLLTIDRYTGRSGSATDTDAWS
jgi:hypothetical protein